MSIAYHNAKRDALQRSNQIGSNITSLSGINWAYNEELGTLGLVLVWQILDPEIAAAEAPDLFPTGDVQDVTDLLAHNFEVYEGDFTQDPSNWTPFDKPIVQVQTQGSYGNLRLNFENVGNGTTQLIVCGNAGLALSNSGRNTGAFCFLTTKPEP